MQFYNKISDIGTKLLPIIGAGTVTYLAAHALFSSVVCAKDIIKQALKNELIRTYGKDSYALVTGASEGIGKAFCEELVKEGFNIILISRSRDKLQKAVADLKKIREDVDTKIIVADFTKCHEEDFFKSLEDDLQDLNISILVNNVGLETMNTFEQIAPEFIQSLIIVNTLSVVLLSRIMIKKFGERKGRSAIINVSSISGLRPVPFFNPYGSSKAFIDFFSEAIARELNSSRIDVVSFRPGYVQTGMTAMKEPSINTITPNQCARGVLNKLGIESVTSGHWKHRLLARTLTFFPESIYLKAIRPIIGKEMRRRKASFGHGGH